MKNKPKKIYLQLIENDGEVTWSEERINDTDIKYVLPVECESIKPQPTGIEEIEKLAKLMHDTYEDKAREFGWSTQKKTRVAFRDLPESNKRTMLAVAEVVYATTRREAVEEFAEYYDNDVFPEKGYAKSTVEKFLKEKPQ